MTYTEKLPLEEVYLEHFGILGMKWGIRKDREISVRGPRPKGFYMDPKLPKTSTIPARDVAVLMQRKYGFKITGVKASDLAPEDPLYRALAYVKTTGKQSNELYAAHRDIRKEVKYSERVGHLAKGCGHNHSVFTHEAGHALFHSADKYKYDTSRRLWQVTSGPHLEARNKAFQESFKESQKGWMPRGSYASRISGYASMSNNRREIEAELFTIYHWSPNPPPFIKVWGETLHREMGVDPTPFREEAKGV